jgi:hypothetical protein
VNTLRPGEFVKAIQADPAWAGQLQNQLRITGLCNLNGQPISKLSPLIHFAGAAMFKRCTNLKVAEGNFEKFVDFRESGIEALGKLKTTKAASGLHCDLTNTPLAKKDPILAARTMTASDDPKVWENVAELVLTSLARDTGRLLYYAAVTARKIAAVRSLKKHGDSMEI